MFQKGQKVYWDSTHKNAYSNTGINIRKKPYLCEIYEVISNERIKIILPCKAIKNKSTNTRWNVEPKSLKPIKLKPYQMKPVTVIIKNQEEVFP